MIKKKVFDSKFVAPLSSHARTRVCFVSEPCFVSFHSGACSKAGGEHGRRSQRRLMAGPLRVVRLFVLVMIVTTVYAGSGASFATHEPHLTAWDPLEAVESFIVSFPEQELSEPDVFGDLFFPLVINSKKVSNNNSRLFALLVVHTGRT